MRKKNLFLRIKRELFHSGVLKMNVIGLVILQFVFGEAFQSDGNGRLLNFTNDKLTADSVKWDGPIRDKCVLKVLAEAVNEFGSTYMFITDGHYHKKLLHSLYINFVHSYFTEPGYLTLSKSETFDNLLIFHNKFELGEVIKKKEPYPATKFFLLVKNYQDAIEKFKILWENRLVNAVASYIENTTVYYYTYFPYCSTHCGGVGEPHLVAKCDTSNGIFSYREKLFPRKVHDLHNCPVNVTFTENIPSAYYTETKKLTGWEVDLLNEILERMNAVPNFKIIDAKERIYRTSQGYRRLVENSDIGAGLVVSLKGLVETDFCMYGMSLCSNWFVPKTEGSPLSADFLTKVFPPRVWILLLLVYTAMATAVRAFFKVRCSNILFKLLPYLFGTTTRTRKTSRRLGALWLWFCLVINAIYQSGFQSTLLVPNIPHQMSTTREVLNSNLKILGVMDIITDALPYFTQRYKLTSRRFRNRKFSYEELVYRMVVKKDSAFLGFKETVLYHIERTEFADKIYTSDSCIIKYLLAFVLRKNSHLTETVVKFSNMLNENGFLVFYIRKHFSKESRHDIPKKLKRILTPIKDGKCNVLPPPINMDKIYVVFMCLAGGILLALAVFIMELMSIWNWEKIKHMVLRELKLAWPCN